MTKTSGSVWWTAIAVATACSIGLLGCRAIDPPGLAQRRSRALPDPARGGVDGQPVTILFLSFRPALADLEPGRVYGRKLNERGFVFAEADYMAPLAPEFLERFNVFVFDKQPGGDYDYREGIDNYRRNLETVYALVERGAGLLTYAGADAGFLAGWNRDMAPFGISARHRGVWDASTAGLANWQAYVENSYGWTERLRRRHPVTDGLRRVYFPMGELNGTGVYPTLPLMHDENWTALIETSPHAGLTIFEPSPANRLLPEPDAPQAYTICAVRDYGRGRMAALSISPEFTHRGGYGQGETMYELNLGTPRGRALETGDGETPSDLGELLMRLYAWLAGNSGAAGLGGYAQDEPLGMTDPAPPRAIEAPGLWRRALIGPRTAYSSGSGRVAEYADAARAEGYSLLVLVESFPHLSRENWNALVADCTAASDADFIVLPGFEIEDVEGGRFIYVAPPEYPHPSWLCEQGLRLLNAYTLNFYYARHMVILHRAGSTPIPAERLKHFSGLSVYTYRDGVLADNSLHAFHWKVQSASFPIPVVVHELTAPEQVQQAAGRGFQQYLPEMQRLEDAVNRFCRSGFNNFVHPQISEGPLIHELEVKTDLPDPRAGAADKAQRTFALEIAVDSERPLRTVTLYDGFTPVRRWRPATTNFRAVAHFAYSHQYGFSLAAEDTAGRRGLRGMFWISPARVPGHFRCTDRQNWLGHMPMYYTGAFLPFGGAYQGLRMPVVGTDEGSAIFAAHQPGACMAVKIQLPFTGNDVVLNEYTLDETYVAARFNDVGLAATPSRASRVSTIYRGRVRHYSFTQPRETEEPWPAIVEYDVTLRRAVEPRNPAGLFPALAPAFGNLLCAWDEARQDFVTNTVTAADRGRAIPVPRGSLGGGIVPLDGDMAILDGSFGVLLAGAPDVLPAGTRLTGRFLMAGRSNQVGTYDKVKRTFENAPETWLRAMGFAGETPYRIELTRGRMAPPAFEIPMTPEAGGIAGAVTVTAGIPYQPPLRIAELNPRWPAGLWREDDGSILHAGIFENTAWIRLDVARGGRFYAGHLLTADDPNLTLAIVHWHADAIRIEAHNPRDEPIETEVRTPAEIIGRMPLRQTVTVPPGATVFVARETAEAP